MPGREPKTASFSEDSGPHLELVVERRDGFDYEVRVESSLGDGHTHHRFGSPFTERELASLPQWADAGRGTERVYDSATEPREQLRQLGQRLFEAVFAGESLRRLASALAAARELDRRLAIRVRLCGDSRLAEWPWESLWDPDSQSFLALDQASVSRVVEVAPGAPRSTGGRELQVLVVAASPRGQAELDVDGELARIDAAFAERPLRGKVLLQRLPRATRRSLRDLLRKHSCDVLHFIGHGEPSAILLEGEDGRPDPVPAQELFGLFRRRSIRGRRPAPRVPRLIVLNACDSARVSASGRLDGLAQQLVTLGVPAVIAMAFPISDATALRFSQELYGRLAEGQRPEEALTEVRNELSVLGHVPGWLAPVLYLHPQLSRYGPEPWPAHTGPGKLVLGGAGLAAVAASAGLWLWSSSLPVSLPPSDPVCPSPEGVELHFVKVTPGGGQKPFCIMATELTQGQYAELTGSAVKEPDLPKGNLSYEDTLALTGGLNEKAGAPVYRLPTNAEWAFAAGSSRSGQANCSNPKLSDGHEGVAPVASFPANELGLYDMVGNVWEWVSDGPDKADPRQVRRGGSYGSKSESCNATFRGRSGPTVRAPELGVRLVREVASIEGGTIELE